jgi:CRISPR system Cascade subunit CasB
MIEKPYPKFESGGAAAEILFNWWKEINKTNKGGRAQLCRCANIEEVIFVQAYHTLLHRLQAEFKVRREALAAVAGIIATLKTDLPEQSIAKLFATSKKGQKSAPLKGLRFRKLLKCKDHEELFIALRRSLKLVDSSANIVGLAGDIYQWNDYVKKQWAFDYYSTASDEK